MVYKNKYETIRELIRKEILGGKYKPGDRLPSEEELTKIYSANRGTINKVLSSLESESLVTRKPKIGSTVLDIKERKITSRLAVLIMRASGHVFGDLHNLMCRAIQGNDLFPLSIDVEAFYGERERDSYLAAHLPELLDISNAFIAIDGNCYLPFNIIKKHEKQAKHLIFFNRFETTLNFPRATYVLSDYRKGGYLGLQYLLDKGCENPLILRVTDEEIAYKQNTNVIHLEGIRQAFKENGLSLTDKNMLGVPSQEISVKALKGIFEDRFNQGMDFDGIFALKDFDARVAQNALSQMGRELRRDYELIGYYNTPWASAVEPTFTSIDINVEGIATAFGKLIQKGIFPKKTFLIEPRLFVSLFFKRFSMPMACEIFSFVLG